MVAYNKAIKFAPYGRRTLASSRCLWRRYVQQLQIGENYETRENFIS